jgi:hypothetical protein
VTQQAQPTEPHPPAAPTTLHQHRCTAPGRSVVAIHTDEPGEPPEHTHPGGYGPAVPYEPGPVPPSEAASVLTRLRRERAEADLAAARHALRALSAEHQQLRLLADALRDAVAAGWPLPPAWAELPHLAEILTAEPT